MSKFKQPKTPTPAMRWNNQDFFTTPQMIAYAETVADEYWAFIAGLAAYFGCKDGEDMRDCIVNGLDEMKKGDELGKALARTVMADQTGRD